MATRFVPNRAFVAQFKQSAAYRAHVNARAQAAATAVRAMAPRRTGSYVESIEVDGNRMLTTDPAGHIIEWGSVNNPPYAPLRKGAEAVGARVIDTGGGDDA